jgi:hypothetical protein
MRNPIPLIELRVTDDTNLTQTEIDAYVKAWAAARKQHVWAWAAAVAHPAIAADVGRSTIDTVWWGIVRGCLAAVRLRHAAEVRVDVSKCFEHVPFHLLVSKAVHLGYPLVLLRLSLRTYRWPRRITDGVTFAEPAHTTTRGVIAGSAFAIAELRALVVGAQTTVYSPDRGAADAERFCTQVIANGGFAGPFLP